VGAVARTASEAAVPELPQMQALAERLDAVASSRSGSRR